MKTKREERAGLRLVSHCRMALYCIHKKGDGLGKEETEWTNSTANYMTNSAVRSTSDEDDDSSSSSSETRRARKRTRSKRDIEVDPVHKEPIIYLGTSSNSTVFIDDGDFDIVSDQLTKEELEMVKQQIMDTCNALNSS
ncbi:hypothetical protein CAEBREN_28582 [Caenorhabditis brenneri]|uniref:Uncharacterized protein n=1 Tax=Caenorhabditis brenneri TaxID=135651 RepID=G0P5L5_CAEBE|nr:hypothetical protein CAEBREN_28582 [Caenorhabditis brenneri]